MRYDNLQELIRGSSSSRRYFLSLPVELQMRLHQQNEEIHSAAGLRLRAEQTRQCLRLQALSGERFLE